MTDIDHIEDGINAALSAVIAVAQTTMVQVAARNQDAGAFVGFIQAIVENREAFKDQILALAVASRH